MSSSDQESSVWQSSKLKNNQGKKLPNYNDSLNQRELINLGSDEFLQLNLNSSNMFSSSEQSKVKPTHKTIAANTP